ncbi:hypothetical protein EON64_12515 [archaeon]|nr:MAG: hypothetical protein EON64_12515 [archaeon]
MTAQLQAAYTHVHGKQLSQAFDALSRLYSLVSAQPGNVQSALPLADQLAKTLVNAVSEGVGQELRRAHANNSKAAPGPAQTARDAGSASSGAAEKNLYTTEEVQHLVAQTGYCAAQGLVLRHQVLHLLRSVQIFLRRP